MEPSIDTRNLPAVCYTPEMDVARCMPAKNDMLAVQFLTTVAIINRRGDGLYTITTAPNPIPETPGNGSCRGTYADLAMGKALGSTGDYKHTQDMLEAGLSADQVNQCLGAIGDMLVNTQSFHDSELNRRDERTTQDRHSEDTSPYFAKMRAAQRGPIGRAVDRLLRQDPTQNQR